MLQHGSELTSIRHDHNDSCARNALNICRCIGADEHEPMSLPPPDVTRRTEALPSNIKLFGSMRPHAACPSTSFQRSFCKPYDRHPESTKPCQGLVQAGVLEQWNKYRFQPYQGLCFAVILQSSKKGLRLHDRIYELKLSGLIVSSSG